MDIPTFTNFDELAFVVPKADCHLHLTGALTAADLRLLAGETGVDISRAEPLEDHYVFADPTIWPIAKRITSNPRGLFGALRMVIDRAKADNVVHAEVTLNTYGMVRDYGLKPPDFVAVARDAAGYATDQGIQLKIKCGVNRRDGPASVEEAGATLQSLPEELRGFVDLNGDEVQYPTAAFVQPFQQLVGRDVPVSIHAGEMGKQAGALASLHDALAIRPARIGHAIVAAHDSSVLGEIIDQDITVEITPSSNVITGVVASMSEHPVAYFAHAGLKLVLGSDDPAFFRNTMTTELLMLADAGLEPPEVLELNSRSLALAGLQQWVADPRS